MKSTKIAITLAMLFVLATTAAAQNGVKNEFNPVTTGVTSLSIAPDARGASMGDIGAATDPDVNSQFWNASKYAFAYSSAGVSLSYTPWLRKLVNDIALLNVAGYWKFGSEDNQAVSASLRYFTLGEIGTYDDGGNQLSSVNPYEMAFDVGYSRKLSEKFSMGVVLRYIYSNLGFNEGSDEALSGASAFETEDMQRSLMEAEGIQVEWTADGWQVDLKRSGWKNTMEEALGFLEIFEAQGI